jgi:predicted AlkP superfamily phosphohydrolase/phosphomutase
MGLPRCWKVFKEFFDSLFAFNVVEQRLNGNTGPLKTGVPPITSGSLRIRLIVGLEIPQRSY